MIHFYSLSDEDYERHFANHNPIPADPTDKTNPVCKNSEGLWFFWNETWNIIYGPFTSRDKASKASVKYAETL